MAARGGTTLPAVGRGRLRVGLLLARQRTPGLTDRTSIAPPRTSAWISTLTPCGWRHGQPHRLFAPYAHRSALPEGHPPGAGVRLVRAPLALRFSASLLQ